MENITQEKTYARFFRVFSKWAGRIPYPMWKELIMRTKVVSFKQKEVMLREGLKS